jgi:hypothetical protein
VTAAGLVRWSLEAWVFPENATVTAEIERLLDDENLSLFFGGESQLISLSDISGAIAVAADEMNTYSEGRLRGWLH